MMSLSISRRTATAVFTFILVAFLNACSRDPRQQEARFLQRGEEYLSKKDYSRAVIEFKNAVQVRPRDAEAYYQLGLAYLGSGSVLSAYPEFKRATELNPAHTSAQVKLSELLLSSRDQETAREVESRLQKLLEGDPYNVDALDTLAIAEFQLDKPDDAEKHLQQALGKSGSLQSAVALAKLKLARHDFAGGEAVLAKAVLNAVPLDGALALGDFYLRAGHWPEAEKQFLTAVKLDSKSDSALLGLAVSQTQLGHPDQAEATYRLLSALPGQSYKRVLATFLFMQGKRDAALQELEDLARKDPKDRDTRSQLIAGYLLMNRLADAEKLLAIALKSNPKDSVARVQRAELSLRFGQWNDAESDLVQVLHLRPDSADAHYLLAVAYQGEGGARRQRQELNEALRLNPRLLAARLALARSFLSSGATSAALELLNSATPEEQQTLGVRAERNWILLVLGKYNEAAKGIREGLGPNPSAEVLLQDAALKLLQKDYAGSRISSGAILKQNPEDTRALRALALSYVAQQQPQAMHDALDKHARNNPKSAPVQEFMGEWLLASGDVQQARGFFSAAKMADANSDLADLGLARSDIAEGKLDSARTALTALVSKSRTELPAQLLLGALETKTGHPQVAIEHYKKALEFDPDNIIALNNLSYLVVDYPNRTDEALKYAQRARELAPDNSDTGGTLGWVFYRKGLYDNALLYLKDAVTKDGNASSDNAAIRKYHLAMAYAKLGDRKQGLSQLQTAQKLNPNLREAKLAAQTIAEPAATQ
jgi:tetratricopeptide (TPR) repeat protein